MILASFAATASTKSSFVFTKDSQDIYEVVVSSGVGGKPEENLEPGIYKINKKTGMLILAVRAKHSE